MAVTEAGLARGVRGALASLHDPVALRRHPLAAAHSDLREQLVAAIEGLKPGPELDPTAKAWRPYRILRARYLEALDAPEVQRQLALGKSQYYREHEAALAALVDILREQGWADVTPPIEAPRNGTEVAPPTRRRARWWPAASLVALGLLIVALLSQRLLVGRMSSAPPSGSLPIYAGTGQPGHANGPARAAQFNGQFGLTIDDAGTVYVADTGNHRVRTITTSGLVLDLAGSGTPGYLDGPSDTARFSSPNAVTVGPDGTVYVGDAGNRRVRAIGPSGVVWTLAGSGAAGYVDGVGVAAQLATTGAVIADRSGNVYVPDPANNVVRRITPAGVVSTFAGTLTRGHVDGPAEVGQLNQPQRGGGVDGAGNIYVLDAGDMRIRKISPDGVISTVAGTGVPGFSDGPAATAQFSSDILGVTVDRGGTLYVMDAGNRRIRRVSPDGVVSTVFEVTDPNQAPGNVKLDPAGNLYLSDRRHNLIYKLPTEPTGFGGSGGMSSR